MKRLLTHIKEGSLYQAAEIVGVETEEQLFFTAVRKKKNTLEVIEKSSGPGIEALSGKVRKNTPFFVIINTPQVLTKLIPSVKGDDLAIVNAAFPNIQTNDFYYECIPSGKNFLVSVCRKEHADTVLAKMAGNTITVAGFSLGISRITTIASLMSTAAIQVHGAKIALQHKTVEAIEKQAEEDLPLYDVNGISLKGNYLLGFSAILSSVMKSALTTSNVGGLNTTLLSNFYQKRFFSLFLKFSLGVLLALLLTNFFFFNHYYKKEEALRESVAIKSADKNKVLELKERLGEKQQRIDAILASSSSKSAFYIDAIVAALPEPLSLKESVYQPLQKPVNPEKEIFVQYHTIEISGDSKDNTAFSRWVEQMEKWDWVAGITIRDYNYSDTSTSSFTILIQLKNDR